MEADLYQETIVAAARRATGAGRIEEPAGTATVDNPLCGDRVSIDVGLEGGRIVALAHRVKGCALCEAAATAIAEHPLPADPEEMRAAAAGLRDSLAGSDEAVFAAWPALAMFRPVRAYRSRHRCVLLPFECLEAALRAAARA